MLLRNASTGVTREFDDREAPAYLRAGWEPADEPKSKSHRKTKSTSTASDPTSEEA